MKNKSGKSLKKMLALTSATAVLGVTVIGGSLASPAMAESMKDIPLASNLVKKITGGAYTLNEGPSWSMGKDGGKTYNVQGS
ncbi:hypothetical protein ACI48J_13145 [Paenibacillus chitinolyticus]|uniref:hypothetical protein n=1 Tax=Paenibacillus chitinolyticus TaxID=79263 RepID=UPI0038636D81